MNIIESFMIYLFTIIVSSFALELRNKTQNKVIMKLSILLAIGVPVLIASIRYSIGVDYFTYLNGFEQIKLGGTVRWDGLEKGFVFLNLMLANLGLKSQSIMFASSFMTIYFIYKALLNKRDNISVGFAVLTFMLLFYQSSFNIMRMMIALSIFLYNIKNIEKRNLFKYLFFSMFAASFHISALVTIPFYWLYNFFIFDKSYIRKFFIYVSISLLIIYFNDILEYILSNFNLQSLNYYSNYIGSSNKSISIAIKKAILYLPILLPGIIINKELKQLDKNYQLYYSFVLIGTIIAVCSVFKANYVDRISLYFIIATVILIGMYMKVFIRDKNYLACLLIICYLFLYWIYVYFIVKDHGTVPYQWIL